MKIEPLRTDDLVSTAKLYADVFAGEPWKEVNRCDICHTFFGPDTQVGQPCPKDGSPLGPAYPLDETVEYIKTEIDHEDGTAFILKDDQPSGRIKGFAWGYSFESPKEYADKKYHTSETAQRVLDVLQSAGVGGKFFYLSETGIVPDIRGQGLSTMLTGKLIEVAENKELPAVLRTNEASPVVKIAKRFDMKLIMGGESGVMDGENPERVLFVRSNKNRISIS